MSIGQKARGLINKVPYVKQLHREISNLQKHFAFPPGHFYSPVISFEDIKARQDEIWENNSNNSIEGIDLNINDQLDLVNKLSSYYDAMPFKEETQPGLRYYFDNNFYTYTDAIILYSMIRHFKPKRIVEIGSGFSSSVMLDTNEIFLNGEIKTTFIEPYPERLYSLMTEKDRQQSLVIEKNVQSVPLGMFADLEQGDFLFVDSSHVVKTGSDVNFIMFKILPILKQGVIVHFHDVFFPFEYPKEWVLKGYNWTENYLLRAFMMYNTQFETLLFSDYLHQFYGNAFDKMPLCYKNFGGNFWIRKKSAYS